MHTHTHTHTHTPAPLISNKGRRSAEGAGRGCIQVDAIASTLIGHETHARRCVCATLCHTHTHRRCHPHIYTCTHIYTRSGKASDADAGGSAPEAPCVIRYGTREARIACGLFGVKFVRIYIRIYIYIYPIYICTHTHTHTHTHQLH